MSDSLTRRREFLFLYDIRMGNPNGDPDENRPRVLPDGTFYVTDVRLKRFVRDWLKTQGSDILVDTPEDSATNLAGRLKHFLSQDTSKMGVDDEVKSKIEIYKNWLKFTKASDDVKKLPDDVKKAKDEVKKFEEQLKAATDDTARTSIDNKLKKAKDAAKESQTKLDKAKESVAALEKSLQGATPASKILVNVVLDSFIDARLFGSSLAFRTEDWDGPSPVPKTLTGACQINMGEVINRAEPIDIAGTSIFSSKGENTTGTFTTFFGLRYGLIAFNGIANEHSAKLSRLTDSDYELLLKALWKSVSSSPTANTRSKAGQVPRLLIDITYKEKSEFQFGCLIDYVSVVKNNGTTDAQLAAPSDYTLDCTKLIERLSHPCIDKVSVAKHQDLITNPDPFAWDKLDFDVFDAKDSN